MPHGWMTDSIKKLLMKKENIYKSYVHNGYAAEDRARLKFKQKECSIEISLAMENYLLKEGNKLNDPLLGPKRYWSILNRFLNKKKYL